MKKIAEIVKDIRSELEGAQNYAKQAYQYKREDKALADAFATVASQELEHVNMLHSQVVRAIQEERAAHGEPPEAMLLVWNWEHEDIMDKTARVKAMIEMYKKN